MSFDTGTGSPQNTCGRLRTRGGRPSRPRAGWTKDASSQRRGFPLPQKQCQQTLDEIRHFDNSAKIIAYLDDVCVVCTEGAAKRALDVIEKRWADHGFTINRTKTHVWVPSGNDLTLDPGVQVKELPILGAKLKVQGDQEDAPVTLGAKPGEDLGKATGRLKTIFKKPL